jgi:hypothetical protein
MDKPDKAAPQTIKQRQDTLRAKRKQDGFIEISAWIAVSTRDQLKARANKQGITIGQLIDQLCQEPL